MTSSLEEKNNYLKSLSPDLLKLNEEAERLVENGQFKRAILFFKKIAGFLTDDTYIQNQISDLTNKESESPAAEGTHSIIAESGLLTEMLRVLEIEKIKGGMRGLEEDLYALESLSLERFGCIALDAAVLSGLSENWQLSFKLTEKLIKIGNDSLQVRLWKLRCLVELEEFPEAVALFSSTRWPSEQLIHANFLVALAYEGLGVREQAKARFEAVFKLNPHYRKVSQKLMSRE